MVKSGKQAIEFVGLFVVVAFLVSCSDEVPQDNQWDLTDQDASHGEDVEEWERPELVDENFDILWVVNNSGFLCRPASDWRAALSEFVDALELAETDFHIALTTTHMEEDDPREPVAKPGHFQSTPQPIPRQDPQCYHPKDEFGEVIRDEFGPVLEAIESVVECTREPEEWDHLLEPDEGELGCALDEEFFGCDGERREVSSFFPDPEDYREISKVLRADDYRDASGEVDFDQVKADLECSAMVGSRGSEFVKALGAAVEAVSPELTGGLDADPEEFPNAGFLRDDARLGVFLMSNVNDCTHDGTLDEGRVCGTAECTIQENLGEDGALISIEELREDFLLNVARSKGFEIGEDPSREEVDRWVADVVYPISFHGNYRREPELGSEDCTEELEIRPSCISNIATSWSGHRFSEFITTFEYFDPTSGDSSQWDEGEPDITTIPGATCGSISMYMYDLMSVPSLYGR